ncbi:MAG: dodecin domain-containing protein [Gemmatimonadota bacterium]
MSEPFQLRSGSRAGLGGVFRRGKRKRAFIAELETELARADRISRVELRQIQELAAARQVDVRRDCATARLCLYRKFLEHCLADQALSQDESADLIHLQMLLHLSDADAGAVHGEVVKRVYGRAIDEVLADFRLDPEEEDFLERLRVQVGLSDAAAEDLRRQGAERAKQRFVSKSAVAGGPLVASRGAELELEGSSASGLVEAVEAAIATACQTVEIQSAELKSLRVDVTDGRISNWSVKLRARL